MDARTADVVREVEAYVEEFNRGDFAAAASHYRFPFSFVSAKSVFWVNSAADFEKTWPATAQKMRDEGWGYTRHLEHHVAFLEDNVALASHVAVRYTHDGREMERLGATYVMRKGKEGWRFLSCLMHTVEAAQRMALLEAAPDTAPGTAQR